MRKRETWQAAAPAAILLACALPGWAMADDSAPLELSYELTLGGVPVMSFEIDARTADGHYDVDFSGQTRGIADLFGSDEIISSSHGRVTPDGRVVPESYASHSNGSKGERHTQIQYGEAGPLSWQALPPPGSDGETLTPVPPDSIPGTKDILSTLLDFSIAPGRNERCERRARVFDGRRRFDLVVSARGQEQVAAEGAGFYTGPALHCHLDLARLGGYATDPAKRMANDTAEFWLASVLPGEPPMPVEIVFQGRLGLMHARLAMAQHGADRRGDVVHNSAWSAMASPGGIDKN